MAASRSVDRLAARQAADACPLWFPPFGNMGGKYAEQVKINRRRIYDTLRINFYAATK